MISEDRQKIGGYSMKECKRCDFMNEYGYCECPHSDKWYACPIENKKPENVKALEEYAEWLSRMEDKE